MKYFCSFSKAGSHEFKSLVFVDFKSLRAHLNSIGCISDKYDSFKVWKNCSSDWSRASSYIWYDKADVYNCLSVSDTFIKRLSLKTITSLCSKKRS